MGILFAKHYYLNRDVPYLINHEITEYDIRSAGFNIVKTFKLLNPSEIDKLQAMDKKERQIQLGLHQLKDKEFGRKLNEGFKEARRMFFEGNSINDMDILSIKKDAIFSLKRYRNLDFGDIQFVEKNNYSSYYYINNFEFYFNRKKIDVKGINDDLLALHEDYMLSFLSTFFRMNEISKREKVIKFLKEFSMYYKSRELETGFYRELNKQSLFVIKDKMLSRAKVGSHLKVDKDLVDIRYNYNNYLIPLISILL